MRRLIQDVRSRQPQRFAPAAPKVAEAAASIAVASTSKAAATSLVSVDLTTINPILAEKLGDFNERLEALEGP